MARALAVFVLLAIAVPETARAGGSGWSSITAYADDVAAAMEQAKWEVLRSGKYYKRNPKRKPKSPGEAVKLGAEEGTHSIMDIGKVSVVEAGRFTCALATACPLTKAELVKLFGSERPTRAMVEAEDKKLTLATYQPMGSAVWIKVYEGGAPKWLYFLGASGD